LSEFVDIITLLKTDFKNPKHMLRGAKTPPNSILDMGVPCVELNFPDVDASIFHKYLINIKKFNFD
jgi:hypothetical protein